MDLIRLELLPPILMEEMQREARRQALVRQAALHQAGPGGAVVSRLGAALMRAGCLIQSAGRHLASPDASLARMPCGYGA